jgi:proline dehydrogenase
VERDPEETMRRVLLWLAGNAWLREHLPRFGFAKRAARRFMPGEGLEDALDAARAFGAEGIGTILTRLGEDVTTADEADAVAAHYEAVIDRLAAAGIDGYVSFKLTQLGLEHDPEGTYRRCTALASRAAAHGRCVVIDMESSRLVDASLVLYERLLADHPGSGICLQAYLRRTPADLQRLLPRQPFVRLVKGAYREPPEIAFQARREIDASYVAIATTMLQARAAGGEVGIGLGTHDIELIELIGGHAAALGLDRRAFEVEMLYGIRLDQQRRLAAQGYRVRDLISYGDAWYPWYMRRLAERPANVAFALRQVVPW